MEWGNFVNFFNVQIQSLAVRNYLQVCGAGHNKKVFHVTPFLSATPNASLPHKKGA